MKCDHCEKPATVNYQDVRVRWDMEDELPTPQVVDAYDADSTFLCGEHDTPENA